MSEASDSKTLVRLFTKGSHHQNLTVIYLVQNLFDQGKSSRTVSLNSHYIIIFRNKRDATQFRRLAQQLLPGNSNWLMEAFDDATSCPYGYLLIDNHPRTLDCHRFRTRIFNGEETVLYLDRNNKDSLNNLNKFEEAIRYKSPNSNAKEIGASEESA
jgi:hypothetical protein